MRRWLGWTFLGLLGAGAGCALQQGEPLDPAGLGYQTCQSYYQCGPGRHCSLAGTCWAECRTSADCALTAGGDSALLCNPFGQCVERGGQTACQAHADCGPQGVCDGRCSSSGALCQDGQGCPLADETCAGLCAAWCQGDDDCRDLGPELSCTPLGRCLPPGWERWIPPGELPPQQCRSDAECKALGWRYTCVRQPDGPGECRPGETALDLGAGPAERPAHALRGVWGMRLNLAVITYGLPLISRQTTNSSHLILVRIRHPSGDRLELDEKLCSLEMINFSDTDLPPSDLIHVTIPLGFLRAVPLVHRWLDLAATRAGEPWRTSESLELRGCKLADPAGDPLPDRRAYEADPDDPRLWDQDTDGKPGLTTLADGVLRGEVYIDQRLRQSFDGALIDADHVAGQVTVQAEQRILSSSKPSLVYDIETEIHPDPERTYFRMQRLADDASCAELIRLGGRSGGWLAATERLGDVERP